MDNLVVGNLIGTDITGTYAIINSVGVLIVSGSTHNTVGGVVAAEGNVISGDNWGVLISGVGTSDNFVEGNYIGTNPAGTAAVYNFSGPGVEIDAGATNNTIGGSTPGSGNVISGIRLGDGIEISDAGTSNNVVAGDLIGTNPAGTAAIANGGDGVIIEYGATGNTIGGTTAGAADVISGSNGDGVQIIGASDNVVSGDLIGTNVTGTAAIANGFNGVRILDNSSSNTIGGTTAFARNIISGNAVISAGGGAGVEIENSSTGNVVEGDYIGTNAAGTAAISNGQGLVVEEGASGNTIGGTTASTRNIISGNRRNGVVIGGGIQNVVSGNFIGINAAGSAALGNGKYGVFIIEAAGTAGYGSSTSGSGISSSSGGGKSNVIGAGNVISGNAAGGIYISGGILDVVVGNEISTNAAGTAAIANGNDGVEIAGNASNNTIGGSTAPARNIISGNIGAGVEIDSVDSGNVVEGNYIGTDITGERVVGQGGAACSSTGHQRGDGRHARSRKRHFRESNRG